MSVLEAWAPKWMNVPLSCRDFGLRLSSETTTLQTIGLLGLVSCVVRLIYILTQWHANFLQWEYELWRGQAFRRCPSHWCSRRYWGIQQFESQAAFRIQKGEWIFSCIPFPTARTHGMQQNNQLPIMNGILQDLHVHCICILLDAARSGDHALYKYIAILWCHASADSSALLTTQDFRLLSVTKRQSTFEASASVCQDSDWIIAAPSRQLCVLWLAV